MHRLKTSFSPVCEELTTPNQQGHSDVQLMTPCVQETTATLTFAVKHAARSLGRITIQLTKHEALRTQRATPSTKAENFRSLAAKVGWPSIENFAAPKCKLAEKALPPSGHPEAELHSC